MAEDFQAAAICGDNWWSSSRTTMLMAVGGLSPCSLAIGDLGWPPTDDYIDIKPKSSATTDSDHNNMAVFQDYSTFQMMGFALSDDLLCGGGRGGGESNFNSNGIVENYNEDQEMIRNPTNLDDDTNTSLVYGYPQSHQTLYHDHHPPQQLFNTTPSINTTNSTFPTNPNFPSIQKPVHSAAAAFQFTNSTPFWNNNNNNASSTTHHIPQGIASLLQHNNNPISRNTSLIANFKPINNSGNSEDGEEEAKKSDKNNATTEAAAGVFKRPRIETPSPLPTFKVRKEKLGDRVTALQQLVSPFGKTDTASVLHEAIEYIKFLHDQVSVLSTPYMKSSNNGIPPLQHQVCDKAAGDHTDRAKQDLRSRGLCLVPISSTFPVTNATTADFWTPTFGGTFR